MDYKRYENGGTDVVIPIPRSYADCWQLVRSDYLRYKRTMAPWPKIVCYALINRLFAFSLCLRIASYRGWAYPLFKIMHRHLSKKQGLHIDPECHVGYGLYIGHGCGVIVNPTAVLGNNINLSQFTTIGSNEGHAATIGDNVIYRPMRLYCRECAHWQQRHHRGWRSCYKGHTRQCYRSRRTREGHFIQKTRTLCQ